MLERSGAPRRGHAAGGSGLDIRGQRYYPMARVFDNAQTFQ